MGQPLIETEHISFILIATSIPWLFYLVSAVWPHYKINTTRCFLELWTGVNMCLLVYSNWIYLFVYLTISFIDIFITDVSVYFGVIFFYLHQAITLAKGSNPFFLFLVLVLAICRFKRCIFRELTGTSTLPRNKYTAQYEPQPKWYSYIHF